MPQQPPSARRGPAGEPPSLSARAAPQAAKEAGRQAPSALNSEAGAHPAMASGVAPANHWEVVCWKPLGLQPMRLAPLAAAAERRAPRVAGEPATGAQVQLTSHPWTGMPVAMMASQAACNVWPLRRRGGRGMATSSRSVHDTQSGFCPPAVAVTWHGTSACDTQLAVSTSQTSMDGDRACTSRR